jgi:3-dehydroquinate dehydratase-1
MILKPRIVAVLGKEAARDVLSLADADMIEVRLDLVEGDRLEVMKAVRKATDLPIIATNRLKSDGGQFEGSEEQRLGLLAKAADYADYVDIELCAKQRTELIKRVSRPAIVSYHNFTCTPGREELRAILEKMSCSGAAIAKIAVTPTCLRDNLEVLGLLLEAKMPLCVIAMGEMGRHLRAVAPLYGSVLTYGYVSRAVAPGQMSIAELKEAQRLLDPVSAAC